MSGLVGPDPNACDPRRLTAFIRAETIVGVAPLVPEIELHLALASRAIFQAAERFTGDGGRWPPYWAFAWPGGQGLARYLLDHPELCRSRTVADVGAGSGLAAIAALKAGAGRATAIDPDPMACAAARMNATQNGVDLGLDNRDPLGSLPDADLVLIGDLVYEPELETRVTGFIEAVRRQGTTILFADRTTARRPAVDMVQLAEYRAPLAPALEDGHIEHARVWLVEPTGRRRPRPRSGG